MSDLLISVKVNRRGVIWKAKTRLVTIEDKLSRLVSAVRPLISADKQMEQMIGGEDSTAMKKAREKLQEVR